MLCARVCHTHKYTHTHTHHTQLCQYVYGDRLLAFEDVRKVYDFDVFLEGYRPKKADKFVEQQFAVDFEVRAVGEEQRVFARAKSAISDKTRWHPWVQMCPSLLDLIPPQIHAPTIVPPVASNKEWVDFIPKVCPSLLAYVSTFLHSSFTQH